MLRFLSLGFFGDAMNAVFEKFHTAKQQLLSGSQFHNGSRVCGLWTVTFPALSVSSKGEEEQ